MDMVKFWKAFHCEIDVGLASIWEVLGLGGKKGSLVEVEDAGL